jgi:hypothetical protein
VSVADPRPPVGVAVIVRTTPPQYFANHGFTTAGSDTPAHTEFEPRLVGEIEVRRRVACIHWEGGGARTSLGPVELDNIDGALDEWIGSGLRDTQVEYYVGTVGAAFTTWTRAATGVVERATGQGETSVSLIVADPLAKLQRPMVTAFYESDVAGEVSGRPRPVCIGEALSVPAILVATSPSAQFDVNDRAFDFIDQVRESGSLMTEGSQWEEYHQAGRQGFRRLAALTGRNVADVSGDLRVGATDLLLDIGAFTTWGLGNPSGWTVVESGGNSVQESGAGGQCRFTSDGSTTVSIAKSSLLTASARYVLTGEVITATAGTLQITDGTNTFELTRAGVFSFAWVASGTTLTIRAKSGESTDMVIDDVVLRTATVARRLPDVLRALVIDRGPLVEADLHAASITALDTAASYDLALWAEGGTVADWLQACMDSYGGWYFPDTLGLLRVGRLTVPSGTPVLEISPENILGELQQDEDTAPGLSWHVAAQRNWYVYGDGELSSGLSDADRITLTSPYRARKRPSADPPEVYAHALGAVGAQRPGTSGLGIGRPTLLRIADDAQDEADRLPDLFGAQAYFNAAPVAVDATAAATLLPGDVVQITYPRFDLAGGELAIAIEIGLTLGRGEVQVVTWRPTP